MKLLLGHNLQHAKKKLKYNNRKNPQHFNIRGKILICTHFFNLIFFLQDSCPTLSTFCSICINRKNKSKIGSDKILDLVN